MKDMETAITAAPAAPAPKRTPQPESTLDALYDQLDRTQPGSKESLRISALILKALKDIWSPTKGGGGAFVIPKF